MVLEIEVGEVVFEELEELEVARMLIAIRQK